MQALTRKGSLLHRLRAARVARSWQQCHDRDAEETPSAQPRASFDRSAWQCVALLEVALKEQPAMSWSCVVSCVSVFCGVVRHKV